jgi:hypothetical protein
MLTLARLVYRRNCKWYGSIANISNADLSQGHYRDVSDSRPVCLWSPKVILRSVPRAAYRTCDCLPRLPLLVSSALQQGRPTVLTGLVVMSQSLKVLTTASSGLASLYGESALTRILSLACLTVWRKLLLRQCARLFLCLRMLLLNQCVKDSYSLKQMLTLLIFYM